MNKDHKSKSSLRLLSWFCPESLYESIEGDLLEQFENDLKTTGDRKANRKLFRKTATRRTKEIGIRKVMGASIQSILTLLSKEYVKLVGISFVVSGPFAYFILSQWLNGFAYHIKV